MSGFEGSDLPVAQLIELGRYEDAVARYLERRSVDGDPGVEMDATVLRLDRTRRELQRRIDDAEREVERLREALQQAADDSDWRAFVDMLLGGESTVDEDGMVLIRGLRSRIAHQAVRLLFRDSVLDDDRP